MEYAVRRVLEQYDAPLIYFKELSVSDPTITHDVILGVLEDPTTEVYLHFLIYSLNMFNEFNTVFQSETPLFHDVKNRLSSLIKTFAGAYMEKDYVSEKSGMEIDPLLETQFLPLYVVYLGWYKKIIAFLIFSTYI